MPGSRTPTDRDYREAAELRAALRRFLRRSEQVVPGHGLTPRQHELLLALRTVRAGEGARFDDLIEHLQLARSTAAELVHRAEDVGLVERRLDPHNRRAIRVHLTEEGDRRLAGAVGELGSERQRLIEIVSKLGSTI